jgi:hypothetical protein
MTTDRGSRAGRLLGRLGETFEELDEARQRRLDARVELFAPGRPGRPGRPAAWSGRRRAVEGSRADYERRAWDEFTC